MEPLTVQSITANFNGLDELATVAARTFPLACPPSVTREDIASFVEANLSVARFSEYLTSPDHVVLVARRDDRIVGYAMLVRDDGVELSKMYVLPQQHGTGVSTALMNATLRAAAQFGANFIWLGVNQKNQRAQRFYRKHGFAVTGTRTFQVGTSREQDYVMTRKL
ncbi:GNAT family N-acetyltransferase [Mycobacterium shimoidei]|uniref:GNAT family N-acetyltransferase n=1 Tax=Mycobacterium shimoidei TaxID=29313 RepID=UPI0008495491|nr:GNAT family N-acetyltransferase [Mycobacterium shimoidei]MCV7258058.1 GNAT family N-acetyltransferase [Mycobacterium shimoidei]ODR12756.1 GNAT family N-acetyltransferase [Mycobacterium shimoidei]ORW83494.1 GNAT family acetyltransferase [Mycobacterium shimoidei]